MNPPSNEDDLTLLQAYLRDGDQRCFAVLMERYLPMVYATSLRITGNSHQASDVCQEVFLTFAQKPSALLKGVCMIVWFHRTARTRSLDLPKSERRRIAREERANLLPGAGEEPIPNDIARLLDEAVAQLSRTDRELVLRRFFRGEPFAALAASKGLSENTARMRVQRALKKMRLVLLSRGVTTAGSAFSETLHIQGAIQPPSGLAAAIAAKSLAVNTTGSVSFLKLLTVMTQIQKICISAAVLSSVAVIGVIYLKRSSDDGISATVSRPGKEIRHAEISESRRVSEENRQDRDLSPEYEDLASKYGINKTKQAIKVADNMIALASSKSERMRSEEIRGEIHWVIDNIGYPMELSESTVKMYEAAGIKDEEMMRETEIAMLTNSLRDIVVEENAKTEREMMDSLRNNQKAMVSILLAGDASNEGGISQEDYMAAYESEKSKFEIGSRNALVEFAELPFITMAHMQGIKGRIGADPLANAPKAAEELIANLSPEGATLYKEFRETMAKNKLQPASYNLDQLSAHLEIKAKEMEIREMKNNLREDIEK